MAWSPRRGAVALVAALLLMLAFAAQAGAATFDVNSTKDLIDDNVGDGICKTFENECTLRAALQEANDSEADDVIDLDAATYRERGGELSPEDTESGDFDVAGDGGALRIQGQGTRRTIISGGGIDRVLDVRSGADLTVDGVTLRDGYAAPESDGCGCDSLTTGAASLALPPAVSLGPSLFGGGSFGGGVAIAPEADVTLVDSAVTHNTADGLGLGGGIFNGGGNLTLDRTNVHRNVAGFAGGGVKNLGTMEADDSTFSENVATVAGGGISSAFGAGLKIDGSTINGNLSALWGGGLYYDGQGSEVPPIDLTAGTTGVAEAEGDAPDEITNTTFADNSVRFADGGAIFVASGSLALSNDTVADNTTFNEDLLSLLLGGDFLQINGKAPWERGAGIFATEGSEVSFENTIVANSTERGIEDNCDTDAGEGGTPFTSLGHNLDTGFSCQFKDPVADQGDTEGTDKEAADPKLGDLRDNGGPTETMELLTGSQALEGGDNASCTNLDQRGGSRPLPTGSSGANCDIGAYEANSLSDLSVEGYSDAPDAVVVGTPLTYNVVVRNSGPDTIKGVKLADVLPAGATVDSAVSSAGTCSGAGPLDCSLGDLAKGDVVRVELIVRPASVGTAESSATVSAPGMTDTNAANDARSTTTTVVPAGQQPQPQPQQPNQPQDQDKDVHVNLDAPKTATIDEFMNGIVVEADCTDEPCLRRFREHAAINTGASHIAGFNLTITRGVIARSSKKTKIRLRPCQSGSKNGKRHKRCLTNLRKAAKKAKKFKVKVVVSAVDAAGNKDYAKAFVTVGG